MRTHNIIDKRQVDLAWISEYRLHLMGIATLGVLLCHAVGRGVAMPNVLAYIFNLGNYGVDIFLFLSGMSMYFSLKGRKVSLEQWYKKRFLKIMIPFLLIAIPVYAVKCIVSNQDFVAYIGHYHIILLERTWECMVCSNVASTIFSHSITWKSDR